MATYTYSGSFPSSPSTGETLAMNGMEYTYTAQGAWEVTAGTGSEGTAVLSTGETGGTKYLREDGDGTSSWQAVAAGGGGIGEFKSDSIAISSDDTALANDDGTTNSNIAIGNAALRYNTTGYRNIAIGQSTFSASTSKVGNVGMGLWVGQSSSGSYNTAVGYQSGYSLTGGNDNTTLGKDAGFNISSGNNNLALGKESLKGHASSKITGSYNIGIGYQTGYALTTGQYNVLNGYQAGYALTTGGYNTVMGYKAGDSLSGGSRNVMLGYQAGQNASTGNDNVILGHQAGYSTTGGKNIIIGEMAGWGATGSNNVLIGEYAGYSETGNNKLHISDGWANRAAPLIEGDFSAKTVNINGALSVNGTAVGGGGGAMEFISKTTVSSSVGTIEISLPTGYDRFEFRYDLESTSRAHIYFQYSQDNGTSYLVTQYALYSQNNSYGKSLTFSSAAYSGVVLADRAKFMHGTINMYKASATTNTRFHANSGTFDGASYSATNQVASGMSTSQSSRINKVKFVATGAFVYDSGTIALYGIKDS